MLSSFQYTLVQAEGDTEAAELLASAFAKVKYLLEVSLAIGLLSSSAYLKCMQISVYVFLFDSTSHLKSGLQAGEGLVELRRIEAAEDIANNMAQSRNVVYLPQVPYLISIVLEIEHILILGESQFWG